MVFINFILLYFAYFRVDLSLQLTNYQFSKSFLFFIQTELAGFYRDADVALVTPYRDGMNLVAKEFVACR